MSASTRENRLGRLAWVLAALCTLGALVQLVLWLLHQKSPIALFDWVQALGWGLAIPVVFSTLAALIIMRQSSNRVGWLMMLIALATVNPVGPILQRLPSPPEVLTPGLWLLLWFDNWSWIPVIFPIFLIPLHFPSGRPPSPRWRWVNRLALGMWLFFIVFGSFLDAIGPSGAEWKLANPIGVIPDRVWLGPILIVWGIGLITLVSASVTSLLVRYRRAPAGERQQIKWLLYAGAVFAVVYALNYFLSAAGQWGSANAWLNLLFVVSILAFPVAIAIAILRYRLYDIDVIIRKTLVYTLLTALLALVYFGSVVLLQRLFGALTGVTQSPLAVAVSTLAIAALFTPLRRRIQDVIDRRFYRKKYDAQRVLAQFALTARDETDLDTLTNELARVVQETLQPERVSVWLSQQTVQLRVGDPAPKGTYRNEGV
jgi:hypothetical protein